MQIDTRYLNTPDQVAEVVQQAQNQLSQQQMMADSGAMTPEQPENPSAQLIAPPE